MDEYQLEFDVDISQLHKDCPACGKELVPEHHECLSCGVVVGRFEQRQEFLKLRSEVPGVTHLGREALMELDRKWKLVITNYHDQVEHMAFIRLCQKHQAMAFAVHHYGEILRIHRDDDIALMMRQRAVACLQTQVTVAKLPEVADRLYPKLRKAVRWTNWAGLIASTSCIVAGLSIPSQRNLIGLGATLAVLFVSLILYRRS